MYKPWNVTLYRNGKPFGGRHGASRRDALTELYFLSRTGVPLETVEEVRRATPPKTGEFELFR